VITRDELVPVIILLLKEPAKAKLAPARITTAIKHRVVDGFMLQLASSRVLMLERCSV